VQATITFVNSSVVLCVTEVSSLGQLLNGVLFEPGHPETTLEIGIERDARAA